MTVVQFPRHRIVRHVAAVEMPSIRYSRASVRFMKMVLAAYFIPIAVWYSFLNEIEGSDDER